MPRICVLRLGHRFVRDDRVSTHLGLVARAFGADGMYLVGGEVHIKERVDDISKRWGGSFEVELRDDWRQIIAEWRRRGGLVIHLTMYGIAIDEAIDKIRTLNKDLLVVVGAAKVPKEIYQVSDFNIAVGHQPHSEIAALAVFLDRFFSSEELKRIFTQYTLRIIPSAIGKRVEMVDVEDRI